MKLCSTISFRWAAGLYLLWIAVFAAVFSLLCVRMHQPVRPAQIALGCGLFALFWGFLFAADVWTTSRRAL